LTETIPDRDVRRPRIELVDVLRGVALLAMATYHFTWDLDFHGFVPRGTANEGFFRLFARGIASSFLFLVGVSLVLAHARGIRWRAFRLREAQVVAGAAAITLVTFFVTPGSFVFFGILHQIALASLVGLLFLRLPTVVPALVGIAAIGISLCYATPLTEPKWLAWIGLAERAPSTNDYVPVFPWTGVVLLGIAFARVVDRFDGWTKLSGLNGALMRLRLWPLAWLGRHALVFYLLHQPILFGLVAGWAAVFPPDPVVRFRADCRHDFRAQLDQVRLGQFCDCLEGHLKEGDILQRLLDGTTSDEENGVVRRTSLQCSFDLVPQPSHR
jgi:uncharacterized membrane protein